MDYFDPETHDDKSLPWKVRIQNVVEFCKRVNAEDQRNDAYPSLLWRCTTCGKAFDQTDPAKYEPVVCPDCRVETILEDVFPVDCGNGWDEDEAHEVAFKPSWERKAPRRAK
ncbi:MAG TPA: hypothetical protein VEO18_06010 [Thermoplasmata archaeon]|nr:hypothetical protein [Thermoplasmata archaeon]